MKRRTILFTAIVCSTLLLSCGKSPQEQEPVKEEPVREAAMTEQEEKEAWETAAGTPYGKYPKLVTYTLGQMSGENNSNLPEGQTYEDNAYTRYLRSMLQIQNRDIYLEAEERYDQYAQVIAKDGNLPDVLVVSDRETLQQLVEHDMVEDLTEAYEACTTTRIKAMYESYSGNLLKAGTFDGRLMAMPETVIDHGPCLLWLRRDWMEQLGLEEPETMEQAIEIIRRFVKERMGCEEDEEPIGLISDPGLVGSTSSNYSVDPIFSKFSAHPQRWVRDDHGQIVYGSLTQETKEAVAFLRSLYEQGILEPQFALRQQNNLRELVIEGRCGAFFGLWWSPNNPLMEAYAKDPQCDWQPYYLTVDNHKAQEVQVSYPNSKYVVVRKGYEHPEIVMKILSVLFDYTRYEAEDAQEVNEYFALNVDPTARPLVINVDYNEATYRVTKEIRAVLGKEKEKGEISAIARSYYDACERYQRNREEASPEDWAAYTSRLSAVGLLVDAGYEPPDYQVLSGVDGTIPDRLLNLEKNAFLQMIMGEKSMDYFETFVEEWYQQGGTQLTERIRRADEKNNGE